MSSNKKIKLFKSLFVDFEFNVKRKASDEIEELFQGTPDTYLEKSEELYFLLRYLEKELGKAKRKLAKAIRQHKKGEASIEEVQDHEFNVFEIESQIEEIKTKLNWNID